MDENSRLRRDLEQYKAATDRVGDENALSQNEAMTCESLLDIFIRIEKKTSRAPILQFIANFFDWLRNHFWGLNLGLIE